MNDWAFYVATTSGSAIGELSGATGRKVTFRLDAPCDASWSIDGRHRDAVAVGELTTDLFVRYQGRSMARMRVGSSSDSIDADAHSCSFSAVDYRGLLERRYALNTLLWTAKDLAFVVWDMIDYTQRRGGVPYGNLGISRGVYPDLRTVTHTVPPGKQIAEAIDDIAKLSSGRGFDWEIDANLAFNVWELRGSTRDFVAEYGSNVVAVNRTVDTATYANLVRMSGADGVASTIAYDDDLGARPEGRIEMQEGNTDLTTAAVVSINATRNLIRYGTLVPSYTMTFAPGKWNPDLLWLGDTATFVIRSGRLDVVAQDRVVEISVTIGDDGGETAEVTFGNRRVDLAVILRRHAARLERLDRR